MGKTALLEYAIERAEGMTVVHAIGVQYEAELQFSAFTEDASGLSGSYTMVPENLLKLPGTLLKKWRIENETFEWTGSTVHVVGAA